MSLTALLTGCGAVTATPMPNQPTVGTIWRRAKFRSIGPAAPTPRRRSRTRQETSLTTRCMCRYVAPGGRVSVKVPEGWARSSRHGDEFTDKLNRIEIAPSTASSAPTVDSVTSSDVPKLKSSVPNFNLGQGHHRATGRQHGGSGPLSGRLATGPSHREGRARRF